MTGRCNSQALELDPDDTELFAVFRHCLAELGQDRRLRGDLAGAEGYYREALFLDPWDQDLSQLRLNLTKPGPVGM